MIPFLRWAGSKRQLVPELKKFWPGGDTKYFEPFAGSACLFFDIEPHHAILSDLNDELINAYRIVKSSPDLLIECLQRLPVGEKAYYKLRSTFQKSLSEVEHAAIFIYLNKYCFNGLYRTNQQGHFNVPYGGGSKSPIVVDPQLIYDASEKLQNTQLICSDFQTTLNFASKDDFIYLDPPFWVEKRKIFSEYQPNPFGPKDLSRLSASLKELNERGVKFLISYIDSPEGREVLASWKPYRIATRRYISGTTENRRSVYELIATNIN